MQAAVKLVPLPDLPGLPDNCEFPRVVQLTTDKHRQVCTKANTFA